MPAPIRYSVSAPNPRDHLLHVRAQIPGCGGADHVDMHMPVWSPGSYLVREYARNVQNLQAHAVDGAPLSHQKVDKATWRVDCAGSDDVVIEYDVFAHELTVRTNHVDDSHAFFTGVATYLYPDGRLDEEVELEVVPPEGWRAFCALEPVAGAENTFRAPNFDVFFDAPVEVGPHEPLDFEVDGIPHRMVIWGRGNYQRERLLRDLPRVVRANATVFGGLPYEHYLFILHLSDTGRGGLEHLNSCALQYSCHGFGPDHTAEPTTGIELHDDYVDFLSLVAHEHFHAWNVKRIRPAVLGPFDYQHENYTRDLWTVEGITSYYQELNILRAGFIDAPKFLLRTMQRIKYLRETPGRLLHSLEDASFDAWIKLYRPDEHTKNSSISYYLKGQLVSLLLDVVIRSRTGGKKSLDDVLRLLWSRYQADGNLGYAEGAYEEIASRVAGADLSNFFATYVRGTEDIDWDTALQPVALRLEIGHKDERPMPWLGVHTQADGPRPVVTYVPTDSPAHQAGIFPRDEIVAVDNWRATAENLSTLVQLHAPGDVVPVHVFRRTELLCRDVTLGETPPDAYGVHLREDASEEARQLLRGWLGTAEIGSVTYKE